jgi:hypothetical protein
VFCASVSTSLWDLFFGKSYFGFCVGAQPVGQYGVWAPATLQTISP